MDMTPIEGSEVYSVTDATPEELGSYAAQLALKAASYRTEAERLARYINYSTLVVSILAGLRAGIMATLPSALWAAVVVFAAIILDLMARMAAHMYTAQSVYLDAGLAAAASHRESLASPADRKRREREDREEEDRARARRWRLAAATGEPGDIL